MPAKFRIGDKVHFSRRDTKRLHGEVFNAPDPLQFAKQRRTRTVVKITYDSAEQCNWYFLGTNHHGKADELSKIGFRSYQLELTTDLHKIGRPREKRHYTRHNIPNLATKQ